MDSTDLQTAPPTVGRRPSWPNAADHQRTSCYEALPIPSMPTHPPRPTTVPLRGQATPYQLQTRDRLAEPMVPALVPARRPAATPGPGLPVGRLISAGPRTSVCYSLTKIDDRGRLADRSLLRVLRWQPGQPVELTVLPAGVVLVASGAPGGHAVNGQGHLRLPAAVRRSCGLEAGDRVLLAADRDRQTVVAYTMAALDAMIVAWHSSAKVEACR